ncbi:MAG: pyruvate, phosphate dikinase [Desulfobacterales bacterium]
MIDKYVYLFEEVEEAEKHEGYDWENVRSLLGGKGANLAEMTRIGIPVPPGFTVTTAACNAYLDAGEQFPEGMWEQELEAVKLIEDKTGKKIGDPSNPLLLSCRSGAKFSMPGMMDTVLNIGMNDEVVKGMADLTGDRRFAYDSYRRLVQMFGSVVMGMADELFEVIITKACLKANVESDSDLAFEDWKAVTEKFKKLFKEEVGFDFPQDPIEQIRLATEAVFKSWNGQRAIDYRNASKIPHDLGTAVNIMAMVFGNMGDTSATGVVMTRNATTGEKKIEGDYLTNAQGEDVVAGIRLTKPIDKLQEEMPKAYTEFENICHKLEQHYCEMQDVEFTIEKGKLWMLQTRDGKRTAQAAVRIAVEMAEEGLFTEEEAILRVAPDQVDFFLHPQFTVEAKTAAKDSGDRLAVGLNVSPGAAVGQVVFDADLANEWAAKKNRDVIMVRPETKPDDVHGMLAARGILTSRGGRTSHAALVARQFGKPAVVGVAAIEVDLDRRQMNVGGRIINEGDWLSIDGTTGEVFVGQLESVVPDIDDPFLIKLLGWADETRRLQVWANADYPADAEQARKFGAQGIGLCRTEHMFFEPERLPHVQRMIMHQSDPDAVRESLEALLPYQREDFAGLFRVMDGLPVIIRLIDPPLHEFLPSQLDLTRQVDKLEQTDKKSRRLSELKAQLDAVEKMHENNPMLGLRGVRLGIHLAALTRMQVRAIFEAACHVAKEGVNVHPEVMIPLTSHANELKIQQTALEEEARKIMEDQGINVHYKFGTMIEIPRAAITADQMARYAQFFSYGTNDLTQTTFGISRDDAEKGFLIEYIEDKVLPENPFASIDEEGVGKLMEMGVKLGRQTRPGMEIGICGEHGGDPKSIFFCHKIGLNYVSCSPFRVPIARLAAAHAALEERKMQKTAQ